MDMSRFHRDVDQSAQAARREDFDLAEKCYDNAWEEARDFFVAPGVHSPPYSEALDEMARLRVLIDTAKEGQRRRREALKEAGWL